MKERQFHSIPFRPGRWPFFYGWFILLAGTVGVLSSMPGQTTGFSAFNPHLSSAIRVSFLDMSIAYLIGTAGSALLLGHAGKLYDRIGVRLMASGSALLLSAFILLLTHLDELVRIMAKMAPTIDHRVLSIAALSVSFMGMRFFGQGILTLVSRNMMMKWWDKYRGFANALTGPAIAFGFSAAPGIFDSLIGAQGWKEAYYILAAGLCFGFVPFVLLFFRDNPQAAGLQPDGNVNMRVRVSQEKNTLRQFELKEALRTRAFWAFNLSMSFHSLFVTAVTFLVVDVFAEKGMDRGQAYGIFIPISIIGIALHFFGSWLSDFIRLKFLLMIELGGLVISSLALIFLNDHFSYWLFIAGWGISWGMYGAVSALAWPRFFGTRRLGAISGYAMGWMVAGSALGPALFALLNYLTGSYLSAGVFSLLCALLLFFLALKADKPVEQDF